MNGAALFARQLRVVHLVAIRIPGTEKGGPAGA